MNIITKTILFVKKIFSKQKEVKKLAEPKTDSNISKVNFINSLKFNTSTNLSKKNIKTLICEGDGLGIQNKIIY